MANVLLIRHGQASFGSVDYDKLSDIGVEQSRCLGRWFRQTGQAPDLIVTGRMQRHLRTAECCIEAAGVDAPAITIAGFDEFDHEEVVARYRPDLTSPKMLVAELARMDDPQCAFQGIFGAAVARWASGDFDSDYACSWTGFRERVMQGLQELATHEARTIWAFTSGGPIAVIANALVGAPEDRALTLAWPVVNTSITRVVAATHRSTLITYNAWPHLEAAGDDALITHR